jgi:anti-sigma B factor antagonist
MNGTGQMNMTARNLGALRVIDIGEGRIDAAVAIAFKDRVRELTDLEGGDVVLNLEKVAFIDSSGLGAIVAAMKQLAPDRRLHLASLNPAVQKVFRLTRMDSVFAIHDTVDSALADHGG